MAAVFEVVDDAGRRAGSLQVPRPDAARPEEVCTRMGLDATASFVVDSQTGRQFACAIDCGATAMRMLWTAPAAAAGRLWLSGGLVDSDEDATAEGDVSLLIRKPLPASGSELPADVISTAGGCSAGRGASRGAAALPSVAALGVGLLIRRRKDASR
jgi:hypothetical protein